MALDEPAHEEHDGDDHVAAVDAPVEDRFGDAVLMHHERVARLAYLLTAGDSETAEASVTETYARLWPRFRRGRIHDVLPSLMRAVVVDVRERNRRVAASSPEAPAQPGQSKTPWAALQQLPFEQRAAVILHVVEELDLEETAQTLGQSVDMTSARLHAGMGRVAELLVHGSTRG